MNRCATLFSFAVMSMIALGCAAPVGDDEATEASEEELATVALGVDTNGSTLDLSVAKSRNIGFVCRYVSFDGAHPALTKEEIARYRAANMPLVAIWETGQERAVETGSLGGQRALGAQDAKKAHDAMASFGVGNQPVYFTVDFNVTPTYWAQKTKDKKTGKVIERGDLIMAYFEGINAVMGPRRTGAYGTYTVMQKLFDANKIQYGWQQTFASRGDKIDKRAQLRQYDIYPSQTGWGVAGAGALDLDRAVKKDFGQWR